LPAVCKEPRKQLVGLLRQQACPPGHPVVEAGILQ